MTRGSIRNRLLLGTGIGIVLALIVSGVLVYALAKRAFVAQFDEALRAKAKALSMLVEQEGDTIEFDDVQRDTAPGEYFEIWDGAGNPLVRSKSLGDEHLVRTNGAGVIGGRIVIRKVMLSFTPRGEDLDVETTVVRPLAKIVFARERAELDATMRDLAQILLGVGFAALALGIVILAWVAHIGLRPLNAVGAQIAKIDPSTLARITGEHPQELAPIVERLNDLLGRVDTAMKRERELTAEVAHELRTPLSGLRATIEVALDKERSPERYRDALRDCLAICTQTERMVESMLSLAKLDAGMVPIANERVEVDVLIRDVLAAHQPRIAERGLEVSMKIAAVTVQTDPIKLTSVLNNLVDNAISYSEGTIHVELAQSTIKISNSSSLADAKHVFDRFWRGDAARTAGTHAGLGLSISKRLIELLGGEIRAYVEGGRFCVIVVLAPTSKTNVDRPGSAA